MQARTPFALKSLAAALMTLGAAGALAAPFGIPFIPLPDSATGNGGDNSAYARVEFDIDTGLDVARGSPSIKGCASSPVGDGTCRTDYVNFDTRYRYDSVRWRLDDGERAALLGDISWKNPETEMFRTMYFGYQFDAAAPGQVSPLFTSPANVRLVSLKVSTTGLVESTLTTENLFLNNVNLTLTGASVAAVGRDVYLILEGTNPSLHMINSSLNAVGQWRVNNLGTFTITAESGRNRISPGSFTQISGKVFIDIKPGAWLTFSEFGKGLSFIGANTTIHSVGLNNDGGLELHRGKFNFLKGEARFSDGAQLYLSGSETEASFDRLRFNNRGVLLMDPGTRLDANQLILNGSGAQLGGTAKVNLKALETFNASELIGTDRSNLFLNVVTNDLIVSDGSQLTIRDVANVDVRETLAIGEGGRLATGARLELDNSAMRILGQATLDAGSVTSLRNGSRLLVRPDQGTHERPAGFLRGLGSTLASIPAPLIDVERGSFLDVVYGGQIALSPDGLNLNSEGFLEIKGNLRGSGHIEGGGVVALIGYGSLAGQQVEGGWLYPGSIDQPIATLSMDNALAFEKGSRLRVNVGRDAQSALDYGRVKYGARDVYFYGEPTLALTPHRGQTPLTAQELNGQSITVLSALSAASTGTIQRNGIAPVVDVSEMPALLTWRLVDLNTNGRPDVTLQADLIDLSQLQKRGGSKSNRVSGLNLMIAAAGQNPTGPVAGGLNTVTNAQLGVNASVSGASSQPGGALPLPTPVQAQGGAVAQQNSWHPEPYSSYLAVGLAQMASLRNMVFNQSSELNPWGNRVWTDAAGSRGSVDGRGDLGSYTFRMTHVAFGKDMGDLWGGSWGAYMAFQDQKIDEHDLQTQKISGRSVAAGAYWRRKGEVWDTRAQWGVAHGQHDSQRILEVGATREALSAKYSSNSLQAALRFGTKWLEHEGFELSPEWGGSLSWHRQGSFDESGDPAWGFTVKAANAYAAIVHVGMNVLFPTLSAEHGIRPIGFARFEHDLASDAEHGIRAGLLANPQVTEKFVGQARGANSAVLGLGLMTEKAGPWQLQAGMTHAWHTHGREWGAGLNLRYSW